METRSPALRVVKYTVLLFIAVIMALPLWYMFITSLKPFAYVLTYPPQLWPVHPTFQNYIDAWTSNNFARYFVNSVIVSIVSTILGTLIAAAGAFAISRYRFVGKKLIYSMFVASMMIPNITFIVPQFKMMKHLGLLDSLTGLILIYAAGMIPMTTFLVKGFFDEVPQELEEAVLIDGGGLFTLFFRMMMPMALPALATALIFNFMGSWEEFIMSFTFINDPSKWTLPISIALFQGEHTTQWGMVFAASMIQTVPVIAIFLIFQRFIIKGILAGAVKG